MVNLLKIAGLLVEDAFRWLLLLFRSAEALCAEILFLRRQLALYMERGVRPHRVDAATRVSPEPSSQGTRQPDWSTPATTQPPTIRFLFCVQNFGPAPNTLVAFSAGPKPPASQTASIA